MFLSCSHSKKWKRSDVSHDQTWIDKGSSGSTLWEWVSHRKTWLSQQKHYLITKTLKSIIHKVSHVLSLLFAFLCPILKALSNQYHLILRLYGVNLPWLQTTVWIWYYEYRYQTKKSCLHTKIIRLGNSPPLRTL